MLSEADWREARLRVLKELLRWRYWVKVIYEATQRVLGTADVYVFGSVVEGKHTVDSDVDIAIVVPGSSDDVKEVVKRVSEILDEAEKAGLPWWFPVEIHILSYKDFEILKQSGARFIRAADIRS